MSFFGGGRESSLEDVERGLSTASMVTRWRAAHPDLVGTNKDVVKAFVNEVREALPAGHQKVLQGSGTAILLFKKSNE